jgi:pimeloyl-ACP methyl ester carboxylesterase
MSDSKLTIDSVTTEDGTRIHFKDWGTGPAVVFSHGWPLQGDAWEDQMMFLAGHGYRVIAHDRRGHGLSSQPWGGNDMDTYADDLATLLDALDVKDATLVGHSTGGGEVARYIGRHGSKRVAKAVLVGAVPPQMVKSDNNPNGLPMSVFDGIRSAVLADRSQFFKDLTLPFYGYNREGAKVVAGRARHLLGPGHAVRHQERLRLHQAVLGNRLHRGPEEDRRADLDRARQRRPDRADRHRRQGLGQAGQERHAADLRGRAARPADHAQGPSQRRPAGLHQVLSIAFNLVRTNPIG